MLYTDDDDDDFTVVAFTNFVEDHYQSENQDYWKCVISMDCSEISRVTTFDLLTVTV